MSRVASIRTRSSAAPSAIRWRAAPATPRRRCARVKVSASTSIRGRASLSGIWALPTFRTLLTASSFRLTSSRSARPVLDRLRRHEVHRGGRRGSGGGAEHRPRQHRLRGGDGGVRIPIAAPGDHAALDDGMRPDTEEGRLPQHQVGQLADLDRADLVDPCRVRRPGRWCTSRRSGRPGCCRPARRLPGLPCGAS